MQAVILAAGRGTRMKALTENTPKPMLSILGAPILQYHLDALPEQVEEVIIIVGYMGSTIQQYFGGEYKDKKILYVEQNVLNGTAGALWEAKDLLHDKFLVMNGDDIYSAQDIKECMKYEWALLGLRVDELGSAGSIILDDSGNVTDILEKESHSGGEGFANANFFMIDTRIFDYPLVKRSQSEEYGLPQTVVQASHDIPIHMVEATSLIRITVPEDIARAEEFLQKI